MVQVQAECRLAVWGLVRTRLLTEETVRLAKMGMAVAEVVEAVVDRETRPAVQTLGAVAEAEGVED